MSSANGFKARVERTLELFMRLGGNDFFYTSREMKTPRGWLKLLDVAGGYLIAVGFFAHAAWLQWQRINCPSTGRLEERLSCLSLAGLPCAMVALIGFVFFLSRRSAKKDLSISEKLFPQGRMPDHWIIPTDPVKITLSVVCFFGIYMVLAWVSDKITVVSSLMLVIACIDFNTLRWIRERADKYLRDPTYAPGLEDKDCEIINRRRDVIRNYFYNKPQYWKEGGRTVGCLIALVIALREARTMAYLVLISTLIINEIITAIWRAQRDRALLDLQGGTADSRAVPPKRMGKAGIP